MRFPVSFVFLILLAPAVLAADPAPLNCDDQLVYRSFCKKIERDIVQGGARRQGRPIPTIAVLKLPAHGTAKAKEWGFACISGVSMRRLPNGWEQLRTRDHQHIRCTSL